MHRAYSDVLGLARTIEKLASNFVETYFERWKTQGFEIPTLNHAKIVNDF